MFESIVYFRVNSAMVAIGFKEVDCLLERCVDKVAIWVFVQT